MRRIPIAPLVKFLVFAVVTALATTGVGIAGDSFDFRIIDRVISPLLANIYLHELDEWMQGRMAAFDKGKQRAMTPEYRRCCGRIAKLRRRLERLRASENPNPDVVASLLDKIGRQSAENRTVPATADFATADTPTTS